MEFREARLHVYIFDTPRFMLPRTLFYLCLGHVSLMHYTVTAVCLLRLHLLPCMLLHRLLITFIILEDLAFIHGTLVIASRTRFFMALLELFFRFLSDKPDIFDHFLLSLDLFVLFLNEIAHLFISSSIAVLLSNIKTRT